jgi:hypothetical protein
MLSLSRLTWFTLATLGIAAAPPFWGADGHRIVAQVALDQLTPSTAAETRRLLGGKNITDVASWADDVRRQRLETAPWHYVDIELGDSSYVPARDCKFDQCVIGAIAAQTAILSDRSRPDSVRAEALKYVVHFVGDLHQPLHGSDHADQGGNAVHVMFQGKPTNLHSIWDSGLLLSYGESDADVVRDIETDIAHRTDLAAIRGGTVASWAMESHDIARDFVYHDLPASLEISPAYAAAARPVIHERLLRAGVRLAATLEKALGGVPGTR